MSEPVLQMSGVAVVRDGTPLPNPDGELHLQAGDTLVLVGSHAEIERAFTALEPPPAAAPGPAS